MSDDVETALHGVFGDTETGRESRRRGRGEGKMAVRPDDGRRKKATGRTVQFHVMMKPNLKAAIGKAAHKAGVPVTVWVELAALAYMKGGKDA